MKRKVKRYDEGGILTDRYGNAVRSSSGEPVKTRYGSSSEDRPKSSGVDDYESMGKRAGATSPFAGPKEYIKESIEEESPKSSSEPDSVAGKGAKNLAFEPDVEVKKKTVIKKKVTPKYEDTKAKIGNQSFMPSDAERRRQLEAADKPLEGVHPESYFPPLRALNTLAKGLAGKKAVEEVGKRAGSELSSVAKKAGDALSTFVRTPKNVIRQAEKDITPRAPRLGNEPLKLGMKKGGAVKKMASGGKTSSASSRGDGIAQRGKTRGRMC